jgi:solute carrier family 25 (adenine nucleotide translocator) protein 4/5/6/31
MNANTNQKYGSISSYLINAASASLTKTLIAPLERVKILRQTEQELVNQRKLGVGYRGSFCCILEIFKKEGLASFWRGNSNYTIRCFITQAINSVIKNQIKTIFLIKNSDDYFTFFCKNIMAGSCAGILSLVFVYSLDYTYTKLAVDNKTDEQRQFNNLADVYKQSFNKDGICGLYMGFGITCAGLVLHRTLFFSLHDLFIPIFKIDRPSFTISLAFAYGITVISTLLTYPIDTIRRRMIINSNDDARYNGSVDCFFRILKNEGFVVLMNGAGVSIVKTTVQILMIFFLNRLAKFYLGSKLDIMGL